MKDKKISQIEILDFLKELRKRREKGGDHKTGFVIDAIIIPFVKGLNVT